MVKIVLTEEYANTDITNKVLEMLNMKDSYFWYSGESTKTMRERLLKEEADVAIVTADSRFLKFVGRELSIEDILLYRDGKIFTLQERTKRILRNGHNFMNLYESGEFEYVEN